MHVRVNKSSEKAGVVLRGTAYVEAIKAAAEEREDGWWLSAELYKAIQAAHPLLPKLPEPEYASLGTKSLRLAAALLHAAASGDTGRGEEDRARIEAICQSCRYFWADGNFGLGQCTAPGCGCSRFKWWLKSQKCPLEYWE